MARNVRGPAVAAALAAGVTLSQLASFDRSVVPIDEGHFVAAARWMLGGELLYRDIHTGIFPGIYLATAGLFALLGQDLLVTRLAQVVVNTAIALLLWRLAGRVARGPWVLLPPLAWAVLVVIAFPVLTMLNYSSVSLCLGLGALVTALRYLESARTRDGLVLGLLVALCGLTKQNYGALVTLAVAVVLVWCRPGSALARRPLLAVAATVLGAAALPTLLVLGGLVAAGVGGDFLDATVLGLLGSQVRDFHDPIPPVFGPHPQGDSRFLFLYSPPLLFSHLLRGASILGARVTPAWISVGARLSYGLALACLLAAPATLWLAPVADRARERARRAVVVYGLVFFLGIFPSAIWSHLAYVLPTSLLLFALTADRLDEALARRGRGLAWALRGVVTAASAVALAAAVNGVVDLRRWYGQPAGVPRVSLRVSADQAALLRGAQEFVARCAPPGEPVLAAPDIPIVWFTTGRDKPSPYDLMIPGRVDGPAIVRGMEETGTRCVVFNPATYPQFPPFEELFPELATYLRTQYRQEREIRGVGSVWQGLVRRDEVAPDAR